MASTSWIGPIIALVIIYIIVTKTGILKGLGSGGGGSKGGSSSKSSSTPAPAASSSTAATTPAPAPQTNTGGSATNPDAGKGTPGWYTLSGHHHCGVSSTGTFSAGCLCTDPKKCFGHAGTGAQYCAQHQEECAPVDKPDWCAFWYASDQQYCNLCNGSWKYVGPAGSGAKPCP